MLFLGIYSTMILNVSDYSRELQKRHWPRNINHYLRLLNLAMYHIYGAYWFDGFGCNRGNRSYPSILQRGRQYTASSDLL